ncbi:ribosomal protein L1a, putative [Leishmania tarentolae]|uniref:Ribosomal protein L1a, putative n=1 Tax=Leishmania tarentolae TaxID=5689 RepID=A0A640KLM9_LEITA|nr:ribosomal protein L1a, putative [Leishmania tarentolae]GET90393.1 ribosomal protein L1a, putative [Leishmania tarentolae]GET90394.1 ribosomal protein L1a, putative [Leishmania tarentolae]GET90395.1 ribosomal protein L1a, putative [Leishmania tarentolae]
MTPLLRLLPLLHALHLVRPLSPSLFSCPRPLICFPSPSSTRDYRTATLPSALFTMSARPSVSVYSASSDAVVGTCPLPAVFTAPIRNDIVQFVHTNMAKNSRQAYAVNRLSGMNHSAHSWGTGRAVARIPRISGGGTSTSGAGAFGNMCRGGRMFAPTKIFRRWHRKINLHQKRFAVVSALAASSVPSLVMSRGHKIDNVPEVPLVVEDSIQGYEKTKEAMAFLKAIAAIDDVNRVNDSREIRAGRGKMRNRRYVARRGPMLVMPNNKGTRAFRNIFGLDLANVSALNLLHLAPGGHVGRFVIWTKSAFEQLDKIFGTFTEASAVKKGFTLPAPMLTNTDVTRIMQSEEVRRVLKPKKLQAKKPSRYQTPTNGIKNRRLRLRLNPYVKRETAAAKGMRNVANRDARRKAKMARVAKAKKSSAKSAKQ